MPRVAKELNALGVKKLRHSGNSNVPEVHAVGGVPGLSLQITANGAKSWLLRYGWNGRRPELGLGAYPSVSLAAARQEASAIKAQIRKGIDPIAERQAAKRKSQMTFDEATDKYLEFKLSEFRNPKHKKQWQATLAQYASPIIGHMSCNDIALKDILRVLGSIWDTKTETASRLRGRIENVLAWSIVNGYRSGDNPARWKGNLDATLAKPAKIKNEVHHPAVAIDDAPRFYSELRDRSGMATRALEFLFLTAARSGEVRKACWDHIDFDKAVWTKPADHTKTGREHRVPLSETALDLLHSLPRLMGSDYVFAASRGGPLSDASLSAVMRRIHEKWPDQYLDPRTKRPAVPHGLRSTFRDWAAERTDLPREMAEIALAHNVGTNVEQAYLRADMLEKRRHMMKRWSAFLQNRESAKVIELHHG